MPRTIDLGLGGRAAMAGALLALVVLAQACASSPVTTTSTEASPQVRPIATEGAEVAPVAPPAELATPDGSAATGSSAAPSASPPGRPTQIPGTAIRFTGGDGGSVETAIVIEGAQGESDGTQSEYWYVAQIYGQEGRDWHMGSQALLSRNGHQYDELDFQKANGAPVSMYFDITAYFGRMQ